jgi:dTDP-4-dehydrorhamnose reductase
MRALITGASGTIGTELTRLLKKSDHEAVAWDRVQVPINDYYKMENYLKLIRPDVLFHLSYTPDPKQSWLVNYEWTSELAWITRILNIRFVFTSTNLVFSHRQQGPFSPNSVPEASEGYGLEKRKSEERVRSQNPNAVIIRLGWQINVKSGKNNLVEFLRRRMEEEGKVRASTQWYPACSFVEDTATKLLELSNDVPPDVYMIDSNERWNLYEIATALNEQLGYGWLIEATNDYGWDSRMEDKRLHMPSLKQRLPSLH